MKTKMLLAGLGVMALLSIGCRKDPLVEDNGSAEVGDYWYVQFEGEEGKKVDVDFAVSSGGPVDFLLMDGSAFTQFQACFKKDTVLTLNGTLDSIGPNNRREWPIDVPAGKIRVAYHSGGASDIALYRQVNIVIAEYKGVTTSSIDYEATQPELLRFIIYNPDVSRAITFRFDVTVATRADTVTCDYWLNGSHLNVGSKTYSFELPVDGPCYAVVNNAGGIPGGAAPQQGVDFSLTVK